MRRENEGAHKRELGAFFSVAVANTGTDIRRNPRCDGEGMGDGEGCVRL